MTQLHAAVMATNSPFIRNERAEVPTEPASERWKAENVNGVLHRIDNFLTRASITLRSEPRVSGYNLYTGLIGVVFAIDRLSREGFCVVDGRHLPQLPDPPEAISEREQNRIGLCSEHLALAMYSCLRTGTPFDLHPVVYNRRELANELLYGRAGLAVLISFFVRKGMLLTDPQLVMKVMHAIPSDEFPWKWHNKAYFGAAHGTAGILLMLKRFGGVDHNSFVQSLVQRAALPSGNFRSQPLSCNDGLVQWCHGAPGFIPLLMEFINPLPMNSISYDSIVMPISTSVASMRRSESKQRNFDAVRDSFDEADSACSSSGGRHVERHDHTEELDSFLQEVLTVSARKALDEIWKRGLLRKGCSICHGIAGNGYAFLSAYQHLNELEYLHRAVVFCDVITELGPEQCCALADRPHSLFEGLAGVVHFLLDVRRILTLLQRHREPRAQSQQLPIVRMELFDGMNIF